MGHPLKRCLCSPALAQAPGSAAAVMRTLQAMGRDLALGVCTQQLSKELIPTEKTSPATPPLGSQILWGARPQPPFRPPGGSSPASSGPEKGADALEGCQCQGNTALSNPEKDEMATAHVFVLTPGSVGTSLPRAPPCPGLAGRAGPQSLASCGLF